MKYEKILSLGLIVLANFSLADETPVNPVVHGEYMKVQAEFSQSLNHAKKVLRDLVTDKKKAVLASQAQAKVEQTGIEALKKYDLLLTIRYANEQGVYQSNVEISTKDQENLNKLFDTYLRSTPILGRTSVGHARRMIDWGMKRLEDLAKAHNDPTELNNPELEIIAKLTIDAETKIKTVTDLASRLGVKLNDNMLAGELPEVREQRAPASVKSKE